MPLQSSGGSQTQFNLITENSRTAGNDKRIEQPRKLISKTPGAGTKQNLRGCQQIRQNSARFAGSEQKAIRV